MARIPTCVGSLSVREVGSGPPAVLWPSLFVDSDSWTRVEPGLREQRRLVMIDGPGHGSSGDPGHRYTQLDCAAAAIEVLDALGITEPVDWLGNAWGGHVGIHVATEHGGRLRSLATIGTPVEPYTAAERRRTRVLLAVFRLLGPIGFLQEGVAKVLLAPATRATDREAVDYVKGRLAAADRRMLANAIESISLGREDITSRLPRIPVPTLFITGSDDPGFTPDQARAAIRLVPEGRVEIVPDSAYLPPLERPEDVLALVLDFWAGVPAALVGPRRVEAAA
jgi:pimeloyl-ACP methyl ester carboxylesterase